MGRNISNVRVQKKRRRNPLLPVFGAVLALVFAGFSYLLMPIVRDFLVNKGVTFGGMAPATLDILIGVAIWAVMFGIAMLLVAILTGRSADEDLAIRFNKQSAKRREEQKLERAMKRKRQQQSRRG
jgi:nitrogen fixation-related uncharacterized protein